MATRVVNVGTACRPCWRRFTAQCRFLGRHAERFAIASDVLANRDSKSFENQVYAATHRMRHHFTALDSQKIVAELRARSPTASNKLTLPDVHAQRLASLAQTIREVAGKGAYGEGKLQHVENNVKHMTIQDFQADGLWLRNDRAADDHVVDDVLQDFLRRAGTKGAITSSQTRADDTAPWVSLEPIEIIVDRLRGPFDTVALEITVSGGHWTTKLHQLGKDLEMLAMTEAIGQRVLCVMFLNVDEDTALDAANNILTVLSKLDRHQLLAQSTVVCVFSPFRNLYGKVDELLLAMGEIKAEQSKMHGEMKAEQSKMHGEMKAEQSKMHGEISDIKAEQSKMHGEISDIKAEMHSMHEVLLQLIGKLETK